MATRQVDESAQVHSVGTSGRLRINSIDFLRGICVLLVVMHHIHLRFVLNGYDVDDVLPKTINQVLFWSGYYAVITFFVVSGFLITSLSILRWQTPVNIRVGHFYLMRFARIAPSLMLLLVTLIGLHWAGVPDFTIKPERASLGRAIAAALTFHVNWLEGHHGYLPGGWDVLWSLSVEELFYLVFPLMCLLLRTDRVLVWPLLCLIVIGPINRTLLVDQDPWADYAYLSCMDGIAFGCLAAFACAKYRLSRRVLRLGLGLGTFAAVAVVVMHGEGSNSGLVRDGLSISILEFGIALVLVALGSGIANDKLSKGTRWVRAIGRGSYEIYLFHMLVVLGFISLFKRFNQAASMIPLWYFMMLFVSILLGLTISKLYSEPLNWRLRRLIVK